MKSELRIIKVEFLGEERTFRRVYGSDIETWIWRSARRPGGFGFFLHRCAGDWWMLGIEVPFYSEKANDPQKAAHAMHTKLRPFARLLRALA